MTGLADLVLANTPLDVDLIEDIATALSKRESDVTRFADDFIKEYNELREKFKKVASRRKGVTELTDRFQVAAFASGEIKGDEYISQYSSTLYNASRLLLPDIYNKLLDAGELDLYKGKIIYTKLRVPTISVAVNVEIRVPLSKVKSIVKAVGKENIQHIIRLIGKQLITKGRLLPVFDLSRDLPETNKKSGVVILPNGTFYYIPRKKIDNRKEYLKYIAEHEGSSPKRMLIMYDPISEEFVYTDSFGSLETFSTSDSMIPIDSHKKDMLDKTVGDAIYSLLSRSWITDLLGSEEHSLIRKYSYKPVHEVPPEDMKRIIRSIDKAIEEKKASIVPNSYLSTKAIVELLKRNYDKYDILSKRVAKKFSDFNSATKEDLDTIPSARENLVFFPHQAEALAKLNVAQETAILDVSTGGGKTVVLIFDILKLMEKGEVKRPLIVAPNQILGDVWVSGINYFTDGKINAFTINTTTCKNWGRRINESEDNLKNKALAAPPNTIFLTSYSYLIQDATETTEGGVYFPNVEFFTSELNVDYVALDESHYIRNTRSLTHRACIQLRSAKYRRLSTGTLVVNTPMDLVGQVAFLDPRALGTDEEFARRYAAVGGTSRRRGRVRVYMWRKGADKEIRKQLMTHTFYLQYREKDWVATLPRIRYHYHPVQFTPAQKAEYKKIVDATLDEIMSNPRLRAAWLQYLESRKEDDEEDLTVVGAQILAKFVKLEQYLTDPTFSPFIRKGKGLSKEDRISPKVKKCDELIEDSIKRGFKCIVAVHYRRCARHLYENSRFKDVSVYYDASHKKNRHRFADDPNIKCIFAVQQSITEGLNLQIANRIIITDMDWTPGKVKQLIARIYRPESPEIDTSKVVDVDFLYMDGSADVAKLARLIYKRTFNASTMEGSPVTPPPAPVFSESMFYLSHNDLVKGGYLDAERKLNDWFEEVIEEARATGDFKPVKPVIKGEIKGKSIRTPWVMGMPVPPDVEGERLVDVLREEGFDVDDLTKARSFLIGKYVQTEYGKGRIISVSKGKVRVRYEDGTTASTIGHTVVLLDQAQFETAETAERYKKEITKKTKVKWKKDDRVVVDISGKGSRYRIGTIESIDENEAKIRFDNGEVRTIPSDSPNIVGKGISDANKGIIEKKDLNKWLLKKALPATDRTIDDFEDGDRLVIQMKDGFYYLGTIIRRRVRKDGRQVMFVELDAGKTIRCRPTSKRIIGFGKEKRHGKPISEKELNKWLMSAPKKLEEKEDKTEVIFFKEGDRVVVDYYGDGESFYIGTIKKVRNNKVVVLYDDGERKRYNIDSEKLIGIGIKKKNENEIPKSKLDKWVVKFRSGTGAVKEIHGVELYINTFDGIITLTAKSDSADMVSFGFRQFNPVWIRKIVSRKDGMDVLKSLSNRFKITNKDDIGSIIKELRKDLKLRIVNRKATEKDLNRLKRRFTRQKSKSPKRLRICYANINSDHYLVCFDRATNINRYTKGRKFVKSDGSLWYKFLKNFTELRRDIKRMEKELEIVNIEDFKQEVKDNFAIKV